MIATELAQSGTSTTLARRLADGQPCADAEQCRRQRQPHRHERAERDEQDERAMSRPGPSAPMLPDWALSIASPASSTCAPAHAPQPRDRSSPPPRRPESRALVLSSCTVAYAIVPSADTWAAPPGPTVR